MPIARLLAVTLLVVSATAAAAQDHAPRNISIQSDGSSAAIEGAGTDGGAGPGARPCAVAASARTLPDAPTPHRVIDKKFIFVMGALGGAETMRFTSRKLVLDNELAAGAPWVTHVPANQNLVAKYAGLYVAELLAAYEIKKPHSWLPGDRVARKFWWAYPAAMAAIHVKNGIGNIQTQGPGGCTSAECAMQLQGANLPQ